MKTITFPPGVHLVALKGNTTPEDFLAAFQYEYRHLEYINPSTPIMHELDVSKDCCPVVLLPFRRVDCKRLICDLHRLAFEHSAPIFLFIANPHEDLLYEMQEFFTSIITYDKSTNGGTVKKEAGTMPIGAYTIDQPPVAVGDSPRKDPAEEPSTKPTETIIKIFDLLKTRGFHKTTVSVFNAYALLRGDKTDFVCSASHNVQKGDWLVMSTDNILSHDINHIVWEVTFVSYIPHSETNVGIEQVALSLHRLKNTRFEKGLGGRDDCIVFSYPPKENPS